MDLNRKIAERRAALQKEQANEEAQKRAHALEQREFEKEKERKLKELADKEAESKIQMINDRFNINEGEKRPEEKIEAELHEIFDASDVDDQKRVAEEAEKQVEKHIKEMATKRMTAGENWTGALLVIGGLMGFFFAWWIGLGLLACAAVYFAKMTERYEAEIKAELSRE